MYKYLIVTLLALMASLLSYSQTGSSVIIGESVWMSKNLDVTTYRNGDSIPQIQDAAEWAKATTGAWCYYSNNPVTGEVCGKIYNGWAIMDPRGLAPEGWRVATRKDWIELIAFISKTESIEHVQLPQSSFIDYGKVLKPNSVVHEPELKAFNTSQMNGPVTLPFQYWKKGFITKLVTEDRTMPLIDFFKASAGSNKYGLNLACCGFRKQEGTFKDLTINGRYATFIYPSDVYMFEGFLHWRDGFGNNIRLNYATKGMNIIVSHTDQGIASIDKNYLSIAWGGDNPPYGFYNAVYSTQKLNNPNGLGGSPAGYTVRCVKGDQWQIGEPKQK